MKAQCGPAALAFLVLCAGCATDVKTHSESVRMAPAGGAAARVVLAQDVSLSLPGFSVRTVERGSMWQLAGDIPQGHVYRPVDKVLTVYSWHLYEADLVVSDGAAVGVYLPADEAFVKADRPKPFTPRGSP